MLPGKYFENIWGPWQQLMGLWESIGVVCNGVMYWGGGVQQHPDVLLPPLQQATFSAPHAAVLWLRGAADV